MQEKFIQYLLEHSGDNIAPSSLSKMCNDLGLPNGSIIYDEVTGCFSVKDNEKI